MKNKKILTTIVAINFVLLAGQLGLTLCRATEGDRLSTISSRMTELSLENMRLKKEVLRASSITSIRTRAEQIGMIPGKPQFLTPPAVAIAQTALELTNRQ